MSVSVSVTARRLAATVVAAAAVVGAVALPASAADHGPARAHRGDVVIGDVRAADSDRRHASNRELNREWVEITNNSRRSVSLDGWTVSDEDGNRYTFRHYRLGADDSVRVHTGEGRDTRSDLYQDRRRSVWDDRSDTATLRNDRGRYVDSLSWGGRSHRAPVLHRDPVQHRGPVQHRAPVLHRDPVQHRNPVQHRAPVQHRNPVQHREPAQHHGFPRR